MTPEQPITQLAADAGDGWDYLQKFARTCQQINAGTHVAVPRELLKGVLWELISKNQKGLDSKAYSKLKDRMVAIEAILREGQE